MDTTSITTTVDLQNIIEFMQCDGLVESESQLADFLDNAVGQSRGQGSLEHTIATHERTVLSLLLNYQVPDECTSVRELARLSAARIFTDDRVAVDPTTLVGQTIIDLGRRINHPSNNINLYRDIVDTVQDSQVALKVVDLVAAHVKLIEMRDLESARFLRLLNFFRITHTRKLVTDYKQSRPPDHIHDPLVTLVSAAHDDVLLHHAIDALSIQVKSTIVKDVFFREPDPDPAGLDVQIFGLMQRVIAVTGAKPNPFSGLV